MQKPTLAIVIPAYKHQFLRETLESIAGQTSKDFNLYIGDDGSPNPIGEIVEEYRGRLNFVYKRFEDNLGAKSLVGHWNRCIEMTQGEEWIWLFTDDDLMSENCVQAFFEVVEKDQKAGLVRFNKVHIDESGKDKFRIIHNTEKTFFPDFVEEVLEFKRASVTLPEFIFRRNLFAKFGLLDLPLAWGSDKGSFLQFASAIPYLNNISESIIFIESDLNISGIITKPIIQKKILATSQYFRWLFNFLQKQPGYSTEERRQILENYLDKQVCVYLNRIYNRHQKLMILWGLIPYAYGWKSTKSLLKLLIF